MRTLYKRFVEASLLVNEVCEEAARTARSVAVAADPIVRISECIEELQMLSGTAQDPLVKDRLAKMTATLREVADQARNEIERSIASSMRSTQCAQEAASKLKVA